MVEGELLSESLKLLSNFRAVRNYSRASNTLGQLLVAIESVVFLPRGFQGRETASKDS